MKMLGTSFYLPWIILLIKAHPFFNIFSKIKKNPLVTNLKKHVYVNPSISDPKNQFETGLTILSDPSNPLFKDDKSENCIPSLFNVLFRLLNDDFFVSLGGKKDDELVKNMLELREKVVKGQKDKRSINKLTKNLLKSLVKKCSLRYHTTICDVYNFLRHFLTYIVDSNLDQNNKYFGTVVINAEMTLNNRILPLFSYVYLITSGDHMSFKSESRWVFTKKPKLIFIYWPDEDSFNEKIIQHLKIQHEDKTVYQLKGIVFKNKNQKYNSFFIKDKKLYDQRTGYVQSIIELIHNPELLIYELKE
ncbi:hypothetical protein M153_17200012658 [Pseudoloma neurophilia]|uniref:Uncharacterized protein n=1 Tax=Pseudoloma neurophilia TaxID=146866 RepID=A0A0R0LZE3_9MICR|nr:hypothetical protein M153_17200012658 [Pseudoloma neurophilia]